MSHLMTYLAIDPGGGNIILGRVGKEQGVTRITNYGIIRIMPSQRIAYYVLCLLE